MSFLSYLGSRHSTPVQKTKSFSSAQLPLSQEEKENLKLGIFLAVLGTSLLFINRHYLKH